jgi:hypothetical protein
MSRVAVGGTLRLAPGSIDEGPVSDSLPMEHLFLQLRRGPAEEQALASLLESVQDPASSQYHHWLSADELGERFGPARADIATVVQWLSTQGFKVNGVSKSGLTIDLSGTAGQLRDAFHTEIHRYSVNGKQHIANAGAAQVPAALAPVVAGFASLNDFRPRPLMVKPKSNFSFKCTGCPDGFNNTEQYDEAPADLATIYNVTPLYRAKQPITGRGVTVVVLEDTDIQSKDLATSARRSDSPLIPAPSPRSTRARVAVIPARTARRGRQLSMQSGPVRSRMPPSISPPAPIRPPISAPLSRLRICSR